MIGGPQLAELHTRRGRIRPALVSGASLLALISIALSGLPDWLRVLIVCIVAAAAWFAIRRVPRHRLRLPAAGPAMLDGLSGTLSALATSPLYVALELRSPTGSRRRAGVFRDELSPDEFRALLAWLRTG